MIIIITPLNFFIVLIVSIVLLAFMILRLKVHPVLALFITAIGLGVGLGNSLLQTIGLINAGFGGTLSGIGLTIILGSILAMGIQDIKATDAISQFFNKLFRGKKMELAPALTAFVVSIPVFGDVTMVLLAPIASKIAHLKKISMATMAAFTGLALFLTHGLVPPTPGILAISLTMGADLGFVIFWGIIVSLIAFFGTWLILRKWTEKEFIKPLVKFIDEDEDEDENDIKKKTLYPSYTLAFLPILLPVIFIASASFANVYMDEGTLIHTFITTLGDRIVALSIGVLLVFMLAFLYKQNVNASAMRNDNDVEVNSKTSTLKIVVNIWVARGLTVALLPLLITAMSGGLGNILKTNETVGVIANNIASTSALPVLIPYLIAAVLMTTVGSMTMAALTAAAIVTPMLGILGLSPVLAVLAIGAGSLTVNHLNNSGFWIMTQFFNLTTKQGLKYITIPTFVGSVISIIVLVIIEGLGLL